VDEEENPENDAEEHAVMMAEGARIHKEYQDFFGSVKSGFSTPVPLPTNSDSGIAGSAVRGTITWPLCDSVGMFM